MKKLPYAAQASQNMFMPHADSAEKLSYGQKMHTVHCDPGATVKPPKRPGNYIARTLARDQLKRAGNPTRAQRRLQHEIREAISKERTWIV